MLLILQSFTYQYTLIKMKLILKKSLKLDFCQKQKCHPIGHCYDVWNFYGQLYFLPSFEHFRILNFPFPESGLLYGYYESIGIGECRQIASK